MNTRSEKDIVDLLSRFIVGVVLALAEDEDASLEVPPQAVEPKPSTRPRGRPKKLPRSKTFLRAFVHHHLTHRWEPLRVIADRSKSNPDKKWVASMLKDSVDAGLCSAAGNGGGRKYRKGKGWSLPTGKVG